MAKPIVQLAALGVVGVILWKLFAGLFLGILFTIFKFAFIAGLAFFAFWLFKRWSEKNEKKGEAPAE